MSPRKRITVALVGLVLLVVLGWLVGQSRADGQPVNPQQVSIRNVEPR